jgi:hypothetical protein
MADGQLHCVVSHFAKLVRMQGSHSNTRFLWRHHARVKSWRNPKEFSLGQGCGGAVFEHEFLCPSTFPTIHSGVKMHRRHASA